MMVGLIDIEPKIVNTVMMQVSQYHKEQKDENLTFVKDKEKSYVMFEVKNKK